jgi:polyisoprenoid-binding protein YceI
MEQDLYLLVSMFKHHNKTLLSNKMKTRTTSLFLVLAGLFALAFTTVASSEYQVDTQKSTISWIGRKVAGAHNGTIQIANGKLVWDGKALKGGTFTIDMTSMTCEDLTDEGYNQKLIGHLKSDDFFSTDKYPTATFVITNASHKAKDQYLVNGNLTIKGITKAVQFPATVQATGNQLKATAKILVDRTQFDIKYGSGSFFDDLGDKAIDNEFELNVALVANKAGVAQ